MSKNQTMNFVFPPVEWLNECSGKAQDTCDVVGVEVPNFRAETVSLASVMDSDAWRDDSLDIPLALGKNISGEPVVIDLAQAPHLLLSGQVGGGKSVCIQALLMNLLMKFSPDELHLLLIDPMVTDLPVFRKLPHLRAPIITDPGKAAVALRWTLHEIGDRYEVMAAAGVKNIKEYNQQPHSETPLPEDHGMSLPDRMPRLVVVISELADLMASDFGKSVEDLIFRITAKGRAAGVHLVAATQAPRKDVLTGNVKAGFPTRLAFCVSDAALSRRVLEQDGAEKLLGAGDMLLLSPQRGPEPERVQGAWVPDEAVEKVVDFIASQAPQHFGESVLDDAVELEPDDAELARGPAEVEAPPVDPLVQKYLQPGDDDLVRKTLEIILLEKKVSTSYLQRRLKINYNRAAELMTLMEERGIVSPPCGIGSKREILIFEGQK